MLNDGKKYRFIDANFPEFVKTGDVRAGDIQGKIYIRRNTEKGYNPHEPNVGVFKPMHESFKKRKNKKKYRFANHYGEFIAYKIAEKIGMPACKVELAKRNFQNKYSGKMQEIEGCISYLHKQEEEAIIYAIVILEQYIIENLAKNDKHEIFTDTNNFELIMNGVEYFLRNKANIPNVEIDRIKEQIIDMAIFDCVFGNSDRNDDNWALLVKMNSSKQGEGSKIELYPMFDNERILGLMEREDSVREMLADKRLIHEFSDKKLTSRFGFPPKKQQVYYADMVRYLLDKYPSWTRKSINKVFQLKERDLEEILEECEDLDDSYKQFAKEIYNHRISKVREILSEYYINHTERRSGGEEL